MGNYASGNARVGAQIGSIGRMVGSGGGLSGMPSKCDECGSKSWKKVMTTDQPGASRAVCASCGTTHRW